MMNKTNEKTKVSLAAHSALNEAKIHAKKLHKACLDADESALARLLRALPKPELTSDKLQLKHCQQTIARELGFVDWQQCRRVLVGQAQPQEDVGSLFYSRRCGGLLNLWFADYHEARAHWLQQPDLVLVPYRRQFIVSNSRDYLTTLGSGLVEASPAAIDLIEAYPNALWDRLALVTIKSKLGDSGHY